MKLYSTAKEIRFEMNQTIATIPKRTKAIPASNLPDDSVIEYWAEPWRGMTNAEKSWQRTYGFGLLAHEIELV